MKSAEQCLSEKSYGKGYAGRYKISMVRMFVRTDESANVRVYTVTLSKDNGLRQSNDEYRKVKIFNMKFGISNNEGIIHQAHSRHLRIYVKLGYSERCKRGMSNINDCYRDGNYK